MRYHTHPCLHSHLQSFICLYLKHSERRWANVLCYWYWYNTFLPLAALKGSLGQQALLGGGRYASWWVLKERIKASTQEAQVGGSLWIPTKNISQQIILKKKCTPTNTSSWRQALTDLQMLLIVSFKNPQIWPKKKFLNVHCSIKFEATAVNFSCLLCIWTMHDSFYVFVFLFLFLRQGLSQALP